MSCRHRSGPGQGSNCRPSASQAGQARRYPCGSETKLTLYEFKLILREVIIDWPEEFDRWLTNAEEQGGRLLATASPCSKPSTICPPSQPRSPRPSSGSGKPVGTSSGGSPTPSTQMSPSGSSAGSPPTRVSWSLSSASTRSRSVMCSTPARQCAAVRGESLVDAWLRQKGDPND